MPLISVITVCYNAERFIEQTIRSVIDQVDAELEYLIIDGSSTDKTIEIVRRYEAGITAWVSEPDTGIADAMNKGIAMATGDYILFLHADDYFPKPTSISDALLRMVDVPEMDIYAFDILYETEEGRVIKQTRPFGCPTYFKTPVMHQGALCRRDFLQRLGCFRTAYKIVMDYDFFLRAYLSGAKMKIIHQVLSVMRDTGISSQRDWGSLERRFGEEKRVHLDNATGVFMKCVYFLYWPVYLSYRKCIYRLSA